jgi:hypothetical protein
MVADILSCLFYTSCFLLLYFCTNHSTKEVEDVKGNTCGHVYRMREWGSMNYDWVWRATCMIRVSRDSESEYCSTPWYSSREIILLTTETRWAWIQRCNSSLLLGVCSCAWRKIMYSLVSWRRRIKSFWVVASVIWSKIEGWGLLKIISNSVRTRLRIYSPRRSQKLVYS